MAARAAALMEIGELVEAFLLRLPPDDPASLVRAALVCKLWRRILADRGFRRRFCELHRRPPMLGFLDFLRIEEGPCFRPTSSFRPRNADLRGLYVIDSRHGRVLLASSLFHSQILHTNLTVWYPNSGDRLELPKLPASQHLDRVHFNNCNAAVLCAPNLNNACDSIDCHRGHFLVVLMTTSQQGVCVFIYSSHAGTWSETAAAAQDPLDPKCLIPLEHSGDSALVRNVLYFKFFTRLLRSGIFKYDLGMQEISWINLPSNCIVFQILLTTTEYGGFGIARVQGSTLQLWSGEAGPGGHLGWAPSRVIELSMLLPDNAHSIRVVAFLVSTNDGVFTVDLESNRARKVCEGSCGLNVVPYMRFCTPPEPDVAPTDTGEGPGASVPSA